MLKGLEEGTDIHLSSNSWFDPSRPRTLLKLFYADNIDLAQ